MRLHHQRDVDRLWIVNGSNRYKFQRAGIAARQQTLALHVDREGHAAPRSNAAYRGSRTYPVAGQPLCKRERPIQRV